jgi:glutamyl-tRNA synthetase
MKMEVMNWKIPNDLDKILKNHQGEIVTRFPPENSGYLHIGHYKALMINYVIAKKYNGKMILRFDNTNPVNESQEYETVIMDDINKLNIMPDKITYSSDYFPQLIDYAESLILSNKAYVDDTPQQQSKYHRRHCIESINRNNTVDDNMKLWQCMKDGSLQACLRLKTNMNHIIGNCRDPAIFRVVDQEHYKIKDLKIFPTYDFVCPIIDSLENVSFAFRSVEYSDRSDQYKLILDALDLKGPKLFYYGKVKFENVILSKRKIKALIDEGNIQNWDDPRLFTLRGLFNHGLHIDALDQFASSLGFSSKTPPLMNTDKLWNINRKVIDPISKRYFCIPTDQAVMMNVVNITDYNKTIPYYIKNPNLGSRTLTMTDQIWINQHDITNDEITLMFWSNAFINDDMILNHDGDYKNTKKIPWLCQPINIKIQQCINMDIITTDYLGDPDLLNLNVGDYVQFIKMNYYMCTKIDNNIVWFIQC